MILKELNVKKATEVIRNYYRGQGLNKTDYVNLFINSIQDKQYAELDFNQKQMLHKFYNIVNKKKPVAIFNQKEKAKAIHNWNILLNTIKVNKIQVEVPAIVLDIVKTYNKSRFKNLSEKQFAVLKHSYPKFSKLIVVKN